MASLTTLRSRLLELDAKATQGDWTYYHDTCAQCRKEGVAEYNISEIPGGYHAMLSNEADAKLITALCSQSTRRALLAALDVVQGTIDASEVGFITGKVHDAVEAFERALANVPEEK